MFSNTKNNDVKDNLSNEERNELNKWRENVLFNKDSGVVMRLQDKGNRFIIVDKNTDKIKAQEQIDRSFFEKLDYDPTKEHISKVTTWANKWCERGEISKEWKNSLLTKIQNLA